MIDTEKLRPLARQDTPWGSEWMTDPFLLRIYGKAWACVTDGHVLLCLEEDEPRDDLRDATATVARAVTKTDEFKTAFNVPMAQLKEWAGQPDYVTVKQCQACANGKPECSICHGRGEVECACYCGNVHDAQCRSCEGSGRNCVGCGDERTITHVPDMNEGMLLGVCVDRVKLARALAAVPSQETITISAGKEDEPIRVQGDGWLFMVMGTSGVFLDGDLPAFEIGGGGS